MTKPAAHLFSRRAALAGVAAFGGALAAPGLVRAALMATPPQNLGPFYPDRLPLDRDNDLMQISDRATPAQGVPLHLAGRVLDRRGMPIDGARVEIWQADAFGRYIHSRDAGRGESDENFQGYGAFVTGGDGGYRFRTIRPVPYGSRTPHIHFAIEAPGIADLVTQMYVAGEPMNAGDFLYRRLGDRAAAVTVTLTPRADNGVDGRFDIVMNG